MTKTSSDIHERDIRKELKKRIEAYGGEIRAVAWLGRRHAPDVLALFPFDAPRPIGWHDEAGVEMHHPFIETKAPDGVLNAGQLREHKRMRAAGCIVLVISTFKQLDDWLPPV